MRIAWATAVVTFATATAAWADPDGRFIRRVASGGVLNSPWGLVVGPESFGRFDDALLVGNFGDGHIHRRPPAARATACSA